MKVKHSTKLIIFIIYILILFNGVSLANPWKKDFEEIKEKVKNIEKKISHSETWIKNLIQDELKHMKHDLSTLEQGIKSLTRSIEKEIKNEAKKSIEILKTEVAHVKNLGQSIEKNAKKIEVEIKDSAHKVTSTFNTIEKDFKKVKLIVSKLEKDEKKVRNFVQKISPYEKDAKFIPYILLSIFLIAIVLFFKSLFDISKLKQRIKYLEAN